MSEWKFKRDTSFRKQFFVPDSFAHPAKMDAQLLIKIVEEYTQAGETILDPMAGSGTTMLACTLGRSCVLVELEEKFCKMMRDNWEEVKMRPQLGYAMGDCQIIRGDARQLEGLLVDKIVTSPPYTNRMDGGNKGDDAGMRPYTDEPRDTWRTQRDQHNIGNLPYGQIDKIVTSPPYEEAMGKKHHSPRADKLAQEKSNPVTYTDRVDSIITSPPYAETQQIADTSFVTEMRKQHGAHWGMKSNEQRVNPDNLDNIGNLLYGVIDKIITSPPYEGSEARDRSKEDWWDEEREKKYSGGSVKIAKGYQADSIITSPPYEEIHQGGTDPHPELGQLGTRYSNSSGNIGNLKSDTYLQAMLQVYQQCHQVLKPSGLMILVTKNFIRNKRVVRLDTDTIKLCEQAGFSYVERHQRKLPSQSFWRVIYHQKHPEVEQINYEDILVFRK